ncbi:MAG TPA: CaiB/BaiF CoA-transferase family protein [Gaiellaceae bacterium]|nr:CaiB/BaiF CoA-transferase family protein [Gaiellaceae bacterium]
MATPARSGPLHDLRVVELAGIGPAPFCAMVLADLGATVLRVERPGDTAELGGVALLRGRASVALDLKSAAGVEAVLSLLETADALVEGFRPGVMERLGLGPDVCLARNPRLVYGRMTGWGQDGPLASAPGHDLNYVGLSGALGAIGRPGELPVPPLNLVGDFGGGGLLLALGIVAAVLEARASGAGQIVDAAVSDGSALLMTAIYELRNAGLWRAERGVNLLDGGAPFYDVYRSADGRIVAVASLERRFYDETLRRLGLEALAPLDHLDPGNWPRIRTALGDAIAQRTGAELEELFAGTEACVSLVLDVDEAPLHPHNVARGTFVDGVPAPAPRFSRTPAAAPAPGRRDGPAALRDWGLPDDEIERLTADGVIALD